jgi:aryl-alcohol dehydrogenase-like predicted oxidoreductase
MGGLLTGRYKKDEPPPAGSRFERRPEMKDRMFNERVAALADKLGGVARKYERTQAELLLGWSLANPVITSAIVGCSKPEQVVDNARAVEKPLTKEEVDAINALLV